MTDSEDDDSETDETDLDTRFQMTIEPETARFLDRAYPDQMTMQERIRAAVAEVRLRRESNGFEREHSDDDD